MLFLITNKFLSGYIRWFFFSFAETQSLYGTPVVPGVGQVQHGQPVG